MQADGNGSGDYMHSGMRGGPHVGAFRRCSFTETESYSKWNPRASSVIHLLVSSQQVLMVIHFPSVLQLLPECFRRPIQTSYPHISAYSFRGITIAFWSSGKMTRCGRWAMRKN